MKTLLLPFFLLLSFALYATGPSYISSEFEPIAVNDKGEVLCKTRYEENGMGAHAAIMVKYGFCIITEDTLIHFRGVVLDPEKLGDGEEFFEKQDYWDKIFRSKTSERGLNSIVEEVLKDQYTFDECNAEDYRVDQLYDLKEFKATYGIDGKDVQQKALYGAKSTSYCRESLKVQYAIGNILILDNYAAYEEEHIHGMHFDYDNPLWDFDTEIVYDISTVTGYLVLKD